VTIELNRRFVQCRDDERSDPDLVAHFGRTSGTLGWEDLLKKRRVVLLAEAGSGKTTEMQTRAIALATAGQVRGIFGCVALFNANRVVISMRRGIT
jgi:hypothetical protein